MGLERSHSLYEVLVLRGASLPCIPELCDAHGVPLLELPEKAAEGAQGGEDDKLNDGHTHGH
jgi:hypothetical protein